MRKGILAATILLGLGLSPLTVATSVAQVPPNADLAINSNTASVPQAKVGQEVTFTIIATNNGPDAADFNVEEMTLEFKGLRLISMTCDHGVSPDTPSCEYNILGPGETVTTTAVVEVERAEGKFANNTACVLSFAEPINDPNTQNDCATATLKTVGKGR